MCSNSVPHVVSPQIKTVENQCIHNVQRSQINVALRATNLWHIFNFPTRRSELITTRTFFTEIAFVNWQPTNRRHTVHSLHTYLDYIVAGRWRT